MPGGAAENPDVERVLLGLPQVRGVSALHVLAQPDGGLIVIARVGLSPLLRLSEIVSVLAEAEDQIRAGDSRVRAVFIQPDVAADAGTPTEAIVIRSLD